MVRRYGQRTRDLANTKTDQDGREGHWSLRLYVAGRNPKCVAAIENLKKFCDEHMPDRYTVDVVDLLESPQLAKADQIVAIPTLVRLFPEPIRKIIGDLSNTDQILLGLDVKTRSKP